VKNTNKGGKVQETIELLSR